MTLTVRELMDRIREWTRKLAVALYDAAATKEEEQLWWLEKRAADAEFYHKRYRSALEDLEGLEAAVTALQAKTAEPAPKKRAPRKK
jgi:hypothetical protein